MSTESKRREILQLLCDWRAFETAFGGARSLDETHISEAAYGPAGLILSGAQFEKKDVPGLKKSYEKLNAALRLLRREHFPEWVALIEPYLSDVADHSIVADWREKIATLDKENEAVRKLNKERAKKGRPEKPEKVRHVFIRLQLERHDRAIKLLSDYLRNVDLYAVYPKLMSTREEAAGTAANAQVYAYYQRVRVSGRTHPGAISATAWKFTISADEVERIVEFRADVKLASCAEPDCDRMVYQQNLCQRHYQREWRSRKARAG